MKLCDLLEKFEYELIQGSEEIEVGAVCNDSRKIQKGDVFVCISGAGFDGHKFAADVCEKGAAAVIAEKEVEVPADITVVRTKNTRLALACMSAAYYEHPAEKLITIGITGTKGKTTTTYMVRSILENVGIKTGLIGTIETIIGEKKTPANNTTPESIVIQQAFAEMVKEGCRCVVMEVSSQGLMLDRVGGFVFDYGIVTNLEPDHIGPNEHKDFDDYLHCKGLLLKQCRQGIINADADFIDKVLDGHTCDIETYGINNECDFKAKNIRLFERPGKLCISYDLCGRIDMPVEIHMPGLFSVYNSLCAIAVCSHFTRDTEKISAALTNIKVNGRVELMNVSERFTFMVDYAHNAMALESLLNTMREYKPKRLVSIFGCGGNRSRDRRFEMGEVSSKLADFTIITSDNPRFEKPMDIIADIVTGVKKADGKYEVVPDRKDAIRYAIKNAEDGDVIILAGKGHENYQEIEGVKYHMDDRELVAEVMAEEEISKLL